MYNHIPTQSSAKLCKQMDITFILKYYTVAHALSNVSLPSLRSILCFLIWIIPAF